MNNKILLTHGLDAWRSFSYYVFGLVLLCSVASGSDRLTVDFNTNWKFDKADVPRASLVNFNDAAWPVVSAPHTFNDGDTFNDLALSELRGEQNQWSGRTWYRKSFTLPVTAKGRKIYVEFEGVRQVAEVYLNGHWLGTCKNGFVPFGFDLTPFVKFDATNVLVVMCDNRFAKNYPPGASIPTNELKIMATMPTDESKVQAEQIPWNNPKWHPPHGGIYRNVRLYITDPLHISLPLYDFLQTAGPYVYATNISATAAAVNVEVPMENARGSDETVTLSVQVKDQSGNEVLHLEQTNHIAAGKHVLVKLSGMLSSPNLWEPEHPYIYRVVCALSVGGKTIDSTEVPLGIRTMRWDVNTGFWINGHPLKLHGWGQRPTDEWPGLGAALPDWLHTYTLDLMKQAGANFVRWGHCAGSPGQINTCDRLGLLVDQPGWMVAQTPSVAHGRFAPRPSATC